MNRSEGRGVLQQRRCSAPSRRQAVSIRPEGRGVLQQGAADAAASWTPGLNPSRGTGVLQLFFVLHS